MLMVASSVSKNQWVNTIIMALTNPFSHLPHMGERKNICCVSIVCFSQITLSELDNI